MSEPEWDDGEYYFWDDPDRENPSDTVRNTFTYTTEYKIVFETKVPRGMTRREFDARIKIMRDYINTIWMEVEETKPSLKEAGWEINPRRYW